MKQEPVSSMRLNNSRKFSSMAKNANSLSLLSISACFARVEGIVHRAVWPRSLLTTGQPQGFVPIHNIKEEEEGFICFPSGYQMRHPLLPACLAEAGRLLAGRIRTGVSRQACMVITHPGFLTALRAPCSGYSEFARLGSDLSWRSEAATTLLN